MKILKRNKTQGNSLPSRGGGRCHNRRFVKMVLLCQSLGFVVLVLCGLELAAKVVRAVR